MITEFFKGKSAIVTGAGSGMGRALTIKLHELGTKVYAVSNDDENLKTLKTQCPDVTTITVDLADWNATRAALEPLPPVDLLVNNAGVCLVSKFQDITLEDIDVMYKVLFRAIVNLGQIFSKKLIAAGRAGSIVNTSSCASLKVGSVVTAYAALKAAVDNLTRSMAIELAPLNIRVNAINPGPVETPMLMQIFSDQCSKYGEESKKEMDIVLSRIPTAEKTVDINHVVNTVLFLLSDAAESIVGNITPVDRGFSIA